MDTIEAAEILEEIVTKTQVVYLRTEPDVLDFTVHAPGKVIISGAQKKVELDVDRHNVMQVASLLAITIFDKDCMPMVVSWNIKSLFSYFKAHQINVEPPSTKIIELQVIEKFLGINGKQPENLAEAINRTKAISATNSWKPLYKSLHLPLMLEVLPALETVPLLDEDTKKSKFAFYEIEGQTNGRLRCPKKFEQCYIPHTIGPNEKHSLKPRGYDQYFLVSDIKHCEVSVLQWLSEDKQLAEIIKSGNDLYSEIYKVITKDDCETDRKRQLGKNIFLKVIYGMGAKGLSEDLHLPLEVTKELIDRTYSSFPTATGWVKARQQEARTKGVVEDYFGRPRIFTEDNAYLARNFVVQSVAATVCLEKMVDLYNKFKTKPARISFSVHDAYGFTCIKEHVVDTYKTVTEIIKSPSLLCPGLVLKVESKIGKRLDSMKVIGHS